MGAPPHPVAFEATLDRSMSSFCWFQVSWHLRHLPRRSLGAVAAHYGVPLTEAHSAAADAEATAAVLVHLVSSGLIPDDLEVALLHQVYAGHGSKWCRFPSYNARTSWSVYDHVLGSACSMKAPLNVAGKVTDYTRERTCQICALPLSRPKQWHCYCKVNDSTSLVCRAVAASLLECLSSQISALPRSTMSH